MKTCPRCGAPLAFWESAGSLCDRCYLADFEEWLKEGSRAVSITAASKMDVLEPSRDGEALGQGNAVDQTPAEAGRQTRQPAETE